MARTEDWREERRRCLARARLVVVKVGSAVLADADGLSDAVMAGLARQLATLRGEDGARKVVLVSSGAVAAGRRALARHGRACETQGLAARQAAAALGQGQLMRLWDKALRPYGIPTAQVLLTRDDLRARLRFLNARNTFSELLSWDVLPIVNENDTVSVRELKFGDNDCLASLLVNLVGADLYINLTSAPGVYASNPDADANAAVLPCIDDVSRLDLGRLCGGKTSVGTGGMYSKLLAARRAAQLGVPTLILPGRQENVIGRALSDELVGTWVRPADHAISRRKFWLAYQSEPAGTLWIDEGAAGALSEKGGSLLPGGVRRVDGTFPKGALVRVARLGHDGSDASLGVGLTNYAAGELRKIMGLRRHEVAAILGDAHYPEVIHRDNLLLDAAI